MKIKKFSSFIAEADAEDYVGRKDSDKEATEYEPRAKGERDFKAKHKIDKKDHPVGTEAQATGEVKQTTPAGTGKGEKSAVAGSTAVKEPKGGDDSSRPADKKQGDTKPQTVKEEVELDENKNLIKDYQDMKAAGKKDHNILDVLMSMSKYKGMSKDQMAKIIGDAKRKGIFKEEVELTEGKVMDALRNIVKTKSAKKVKFANGKSVTVDMQSANALVKLYDKINDKNKAKMDAQIEKSPEVMMKLMDVAFGGGK